MTVTTPGEKGFERKTPIGRVFTKAEILTGGKRGGWTRKPLPSCARRVAAARATLSSAIKTPLPPRGGVVAARKSARKETLNWKSFGPAVSGQSCRMLKNKRATFLSPPSLGHYPRRNRPIRFKFLPAALFFTVIFLFSPRFSRLFVILRFFDRCSTRISSIG